MSNLDNKQQIISYLEYFIECVKEDKFDTTELNIEDDKEHGRIVFDENPDGYAEFITIRRVKFVGSMYVKLVKKKKDLPFNIPEYY